MALLDSPTFKPATLSSLSIDKPGSGGLNLYDLEFEQEINQSPKMLNMMYRNGSFSKRYGQTYYQTYDDSIIYNSFFFDGRLVLHVDNKIIVDGETTYEGVAEKRGLFFTQAHHLYYMCDEYYDYHNGRWGIIEPYIPDVIINRRPNPDDGPGDTIDDFNLIGSAFRTTFHGDGESTEYTLPVDHLDQRVPKVIVNNEEWEYDSTLTKTNSFKINYTTGVVTFKTAPGDGDNNVEIVTYKTNYENEKKIFESKYATTFGGNNDSRVFIAGQGNSYLYFSSVFDPSYFPENNYLRIGATDEDITGFGKQYNILVVFKPREIFSISYYTLTSSTTVNERKIGFGAFSSQPINSNIGCDCPGTIQLIDSNLTWLSSIYGVCTLASSNVQDERNVRQISRNINHTNFMGVQGLLDWEGIKDTESVDWDGKYFLANPHTGQCFMWDYVMSPYYVTSKVDNDARRLSWFLFDNMYVEKFQAVDNDLYYISGSNVVHMSESYADFGQAINAYYYTPLFEFFSKNNLAVEYLKTVKNVYVQCRGEHPTTIEMDYITEENPEGERELEPIIISSKLWGAFTYSTFAYRPFNFQEISRRKCSIKKIQVMGIKFSNNVAFADLSLTHLVMQYQLVKYIK